MKTRLDISEDIGDFKDNREFAVETLVSMLVSFFTGMVIATAIIAACLSLID